MPFDPTKSANNSPASSAEMRSQLTSLNADIQQRATINDLNNAIAKALAQTSNTSNNLSTHSAKEPMAVTTRVRCRTSSTRWMI
ncbi:MAG: hypothetical protein CJBNEKGG_02729 [Prosthecobacter sp.]|nr:hypothetical protein [Prosthecobacter sp.]